MGAGNHVPQVFDDAVGDEHLAVIVEVEPERVGGAPGHRLELAARGMIAPHAAVHGRAILLRRARLAHLRSGGDAVAAVQPPIGTPRQAVEHVVLAGHVPAIQQHLGRPIGHVVAIAVGNEQQIRQRADPNAAEAQRQAGEVHPLVKEHLLAVEPAIVIGVFQDRNSIRRLRRPLGIRKALRHPQPPPIIERDRNRLHNIRLSGEQRHTKALRQLHVLGSFLRRDGGRLGQGKCGRKQGQDDAGDCWFHVIL